MYRRLAATGLGIAIVVAAATGLRAEPDRTEALRAEFEKRKRQVLVEAAQDHLKLGVWCRDAGLVSQATAEFIRAVEVAEGRHPGALRVLAIMRSLDDRFWKKNLRNPSAGLLRGYDKRAATLLKRYQKSRLDLAEWALKKDELQAEALAEFQAVVADEDRPLEFDSRDRLVIEHGTIPEEVSQRIKEEAVSINDRLYVRDDFLALLPDISEIYEAATERVRVRTERGAEDAERLLGIAEALLPFLEEDTGGRPTKRMSIFIFATRERYEAFLDAAEMADHKVATGVADGARFVALVCAEGLDDQTVAEISLHEMSHLYQYGVTPAVLPSWHREGFAETWGGPGTFTWDGETLEAGGMMSAYRIEPLKTDEGYIPLSELLAGDALDLLMNDKARGGSFYAESWAFLRYMRKVVEGDLHDRFWEWEVRCRGAALGAEPGKPNQHNAQPASALFHQMFDADLPEIEAGFRAWIQGL